MTTRLRDQYDWVVLGDHPGALLSAGLAAKLGLSVLVVPLAPGARLTVSNTGQFLDPEPNYLLGLGQAGNLTGLLGECLSRLGIQPVETEQIRHEESFPQIASPGRRIHFAPARDAFQRELEREFGDTAARDAGLLGALDIAEEQALPFWLKLPDRLTLSAQKVKKTPEPSTWDELRRRLERTAARSGKSDREWFASKVRISSLSDRLDDEEWSNVMRGSWFSLAGADGGDAELQDLIHLLAVSRTGASFLGGLSAYRELLVRIAKRLGAHVPDKTECRRVFVEDGKFVGLQILNRGAMVGASAGILGCSLAHLKDYVSVSGGKGIEKLRSAPVPHGWRFTVSLMVQREAIPPGLLPRLVWQEPGAPALEIETVHPREFGISDSPYRYLFIRTLLPFTQESLAVSYQRMVAARMLRQVTELIPFLEDHVVRIHPDFRAEGADLTQIYGFPSPELIPENLRCLRGEGVGSRSGIEGLFVATGESFPDLGTFGPTVAALESVAWLAHRHGLPGPFA